MAHNRCIGSCWQEAFEALRDLLKATFSPGIGVSYWRESPAEDIHQAKNQLHSTFVTVIAALAIVQREMGATFTADSHPIYQDRLVTHIILRANNQCCHLYIGDSIILQGGEEKVVLNTDIPDALANAILVQLGWEHPV